MIYQITNVQKLGLEMAKHGSQLQWLKDDSSVKQAGNHITTICDAFSRGKLTEEQKELVKEVLSLTMIVHHKILMQVPHTPDYERLVQIKQQLGLEK